jgi:phosphatidylglycerol:prolipoprotein diacylglycerol transferase
MQSYLPFPNIGPDIFTIPIGDFDFTLRWYAVAYIVGLLLGAHLVKRLMRRPQLWGPNGTPLHPHEVDDLLTYMIVGVILGGRLGFVLFYQPEYYFQNPKEILAIWNGGMSFHGGFLGVVVAGMFFCLIRKKSVTRVGDAVAYGTPIGLGLGRLANFINGELWGKPTTQPWGFVFPDPRAQICPDGWVGECGRHPSQLYEAGLEGLLLFIVMTILIRKGWLRYRGAMIGVFVMGYGLARSFVEFFREPDAQFVSATNPNGWVFQIGDFGVSQGQLLSIPMIVVGFMIIIWARGRDRNRA